MKRATDETPARAGGEGMRPLLLVMALCDALNSNGPTIISHRCSPLPPYAISLALICVATRRVRPTPMW